MALSLALALAVGTHTLPATDDVWAYPHAFDQTGDPILRVWGDGSSSVGVMDSSSFSFSFSMMRFDLSSVTGPAEKLKKATVVLWHSGEPRFSAEESKAAPLEARAVDGSFDEKRWTFEQVGKFVPTSGELAVLGRASAVPSSDGKPFKIEIDLLSGKGDFRKVISGKKAIGIALTTKMAPMGADGTLYEVFSRSAEKAHQPTLMLEFSD